ncbi:hypothetical protein LEP1GSC043_0602 [Leptospira weilii str. Ecochallenge]|uniref:Uncharacterized protein n=1 Tax=Leptospira weilii str. Ecochallenge TaxID=1049986 RepID=N1U9L7_9LEPT|nr:hypothetical protein LEP1GSC043_0602 [Leptospira weilii str. Ecochallenge]
MNTNPCLDAEFWTLYYIEGNLKDRNLDILCLTDHLGKPASNRKLSLERISKIKKYLCSKRVYFRILKDRTGGSIFRKIGF